MLTEPWAHSYYHSHQPSFEDPTIVPIGAAEPIAHTTSPSVTGTSVLGLKYNGGIMLVADNLGICVFSAWMSKY